jgi:prophage DNA circulation protein
VADVFALLPPFEWRGFQYPVLARSMSFAHENVQHKLQYRNGEFIEQTGARNRTFSYTLALRQDIAKGPYTDLFSIGLPRLEKDVFDRTAGTLLDPIFGEFECKPTSFSDETDVNKRDGVDIRVEFVHAPEDEDADPEGSQVNFSGLADDGAQLNVELAASGQFEQFVAEGGLTDPLSAIAGVGAQIDRQGDKVIAALDDLAFRCEKVEAQADKLEDPNNWPLKRAARRVRESAIRLKTRADNPQERVKVVIRRQQSTLSVVATELGVSVQELLRLNPALAKLPFVPAGTQVLAPLR